MTIEERNTIAMSCVNLIHTIINNNFNNIINYEHDELFQVGFLGLLKAINEFKKDIITVPGSEFSKFAATHIINSIRWFLADDYRQYGYFNSNNDIFSEPIIENDIVEDLATSFQKINKIHDKLNELLYKKLTKDQASLIKAYFGIDGPALSLNDIAQRLDVTRERIRQKIDVAIRKLKYGNNNQVTNSIKKELKAL